MMNFIKKLFSGDTAEKMEDKLVQNKEKHFDILKYDGIRALRIGKLPYATQCLKEALTIKDDIETRNYLITSYIRLNQLEDAHCLLTTAIENSPEEASNYLMLGNILYMQEDYTSMLDVLQRGVQFHPQHPQLHYLLAKAHRSNHSPLQAIAELTLAITMQEDYYEAYQLRVTTLLEMGQVESAVADAETMFQLAPEDEQSLLALGEVHYMRGNISQALEHFIAATEINPFNEKAYLNIALLLNEQGKKSEAIEKLDEAIEVNPNSPLLFHYRGKVKLETGDSKGSAEDLKRSLELAPESGKQISGEFHNEQRNPLETASII